MASETIPIRSASDSKLDNTRTEIATPAKDGLGELGPKLNAYHFGDFLGLVGLALTIATFIQARSAKAAAKEAAAQAIEHRNHSEATSLLAELSSYLKGVRDLYESGNLHLLNLTTDRAVSLTMEIRAAKQEDSSLCKLMEEIEIHLRENRPYSKDEDKLKRLHQVYGNQTVRFADRVDKIKSSKVKNGK